MIGIALGMAMSRIPIVRWFFDPIVSVGFPMPKVAFLPVIILWLGVYDASKITMIVVDAAFPVITATIIGLQGVDKYLLWSARNMGASNRELLWQIALPAALPQILTGLQVALPIALILAVFTEMVMGGYGLGGAMMNGVAVCGFARRVCRHSGDRDRRLCAGEGHGGAAPPSADVAPGSDGAEHGVRTSPPAQAGADIPDWRVIEIGLARFRGIDRQKTGRLAPPGWPPSGPPA